MPVFDAASISTTSIALPAVTSRQNRHSLQGSGAGPRSQTRALARMRAVVVLPTPRPPVSKKAWGTRFSRIAFWSGRVTCSWPTTSANSCGRHFRAKTWYDTADHPPRSALHVHAPEQNAGRHRPTGPVQARHPCGTREILFTAASFRT